MNPEELEDYTPEEVVEEETIVPVQTDKTDANLKSALAQKEHFRKKAQELEAKLAEVQKPAAAPLAVEDYIDISTSLDGLDQREKAYLAEQHKLSGKPLKEIREDEDFQLWQGAYRAKMEKENALKPNATQALEDEPKGLTARLRNASVAEKEEMLRAAGLYKEFRPRGDRSRIGN